MRQPEFRSLLQAESSKVGLSLEDRCLDRLTAHYQLLVKWSRAVRLVGSTDPATIIGRHILESLALLPYVPEPRGSLLDIGSGNGFPAIPLKCALPDLRLGMVEPTVRKGAFLTTAIAHLELADAEVIRGRVDKHRDLARLGRWDCITMRAVAAIPAVLAGAGQALRPGGRLLFMVGAEGRDEIYRRLTPKLELVAVHQLPDCRASFIAVVTLSRGECSKTVH